MPDRRRAGQAGGVLHRVTIGVAGPDARRQIAREPDGPVVAEIGRGAGLGGGGAAQLQRAVGPEHGFAGVVIAQDVCHEKCRAPRDGLNRLCVPIQVQRATESVCGGQDGVCLREDAAIAQRAVGAREFQQRDFAAAQRQAQAIVASVAQAVYAQRLRPFDHAVNRHAGKQFYGRDVEAVGKRRAHRHRAAKLAVVVPGRIEPVFPCAAVIFQGDDSSQAHPTALCSG